MERNAPGPLHVSSLAFIEGLYEQYVQDPLSVDSPWRSYFRRFRGPDPAHSASPSGQAMAPNGRGSRESLQERVDWLVHEYRTRGYTAADLDPLSDPPEAPAGLDPAVHGLTDEDLDRKFDWAIGEGRRLTLRRIVGKLRETYCGPIGVEYMHIRDALARRWLQDRMESTSNELALTKKEQVRVLTQLTRATTFEQFTRKRFIGAKTFSLEGAEGLIPMLHGAIERAGDHDVREILIAMAHRGRLNVLVNVLGKPFGEIFRELGESDPEQARRQRGSGDVSYHLGHSADRETASGATVHLSLCFNPSHLEFINAVALGRMRAKQDRTSDEWRNRGVAVLIHGDAAFAGEGIVQETLNLSALEAYRTGGAVHIIVNNRIGFTTPPREYTSACCATGVARTLGIPIFHVNGEDPDAMNRVVPMAMDFRRAFARDVVIDMHCYRRLGHNETDEPAFTQPLLYKKVEEKRTLRELYLASLLRQGVVTQEDADTIEREIADELEAAYAESSEEDAPGDGVEWPPAGVWEGFSGGEEPESGIDTGVDVEHLRELLRRQADLPQGFAPDRKIQRGLKQRLEMARGDRGLDWAAAESLAFATLAMDGIRVRMSGQDTERGTFGHRHAVLHDASTGDIWMPLAHLSADQAPVEIFNSPLSEAGVLGFEYGYSLDYPGALVLWEAQFGDFANAAQVVIDEFVASAEDKWNRLSGVVLLLPHGFEGRGPEHSSARLERFLTLAAEHNIQITIPSTPAQYFHLLRRQALRKWRKPLIVLTPKSLLRSRRSVSALEDCASGAFVPVLAGENSWPKAPERVILASGKLALELEAEGQERCDASVHVIRVEQLYPFPKPDLERALSRFPPYTPIFWAQEEPRNMGAWTWLSSRLREGLEGGRALAGVICREESASPATGSPAAHKEEQEKLMDLAFGPQRSIGRRVV